MSKVAILSISEKTGAVKIVGVAANDQEALASVKSSGSYVFLEVHEVKKSASKTKNEHE